MEEQESKQQDQPPLMEAPTITLKVGELIITLPIFQDTKITEEHLDMSIKKIKEMLKDQAIKTYLGLVKVKQEGSYLG